MATGTVTLCHSLLLTAALIPFSTSASTSSSSSPSPSPSPSSSSSSTFSSSYSSNPFHLRFARASPDEGADGGDVVGALQSVAEALRNVGVVLRLRTKDEEESTSSSSSSSSSFLEEFLALLTEREREARARDAEMVAFLRTLRKEPCLFREDAPAQGSQGTIRDSQGTSHNPKRKVVTSQKTLEIPQGGTMIPQGIVEDPQGKTSFSKRPMGDPQGTEGETRGTAEDPQEMIQSLSSRLEAIETKMADETSKTTLLIKSLKDEMGLVRERLRVIELQISREDEELQKLAHDAPPATTGAPRVSGEQPKDRYNNQTKEPPEEPSSNDRSIDAFNEIEVHPTMRPALQLTTISTPPPTPPPPPLSTSSSQSWESGESSRPQNIETKFLSPQEADPPPRLGMTREQRPLNAPPPGCRAPFREVGRDCLYIHDVEMTWLDARRHCQQHGGDLVVPVQRKRYKYHDWRPMSKSHPDLFDFLQKERKNWSVIGLLVWLGAADVDQDGKTTWITLGDGQGRERTEGRERRKGQQVLEPDEDYGLDVGGKCAGAGVWHDATYGLWAFECNSVLFPLCQLPMHHY